MTTQPIDPAQLKEWKEIAEAGLVRDLTVKECEILIESYPRVFAEVERLRSAEAEAARLRAEADGLHSELRAIYAKWNDYASVEAQRNVLATRTP